MHNPKMARHVIAGWLLCAATVAVAGPAGNGPLVPVQTIPLPNVSGRIDHLAVDLERSRLFVAALGNNTVEVIDLRAGAVSRSLPGFHEPQGIASAVTSIAVANGGTGDLSWIDAQNLDRGKSLTLGDDADNVRYDAVAKRLYVGYGSGSIAAVDPATGQKLAETIVGGHPESFQLERSGGRMFVNVPGARKIAVIDRAIMKVTATWPVTDASSNYPMAVDEAGHRLFVGCRRPAKVLVYDTQSGKVISSTDIVGDTDDLFYDVSLAPVVCDRRRRIRGPVSGARRRNAGSVCALADRRGCPYRAVRSGAATSVHRRPSSWWTAVGDSCVRRSVNWFRGARSSS